MGATAHLNNNGSQYVGVDSDIGKNRSILNNTGNTNHFSCCGERSESTQSETSQARPDLIWMDGFVLSKGVASSLVRQTHVDHPLTGNAIPRNGTRELSSQGTFPTCGQHSCAMLTSSTWQNLNPVNLINQTGTVATTRSDLANLLRGNGVDAASFANRNVDDLARYTQSGKPVITRVTGNMVFHIG